MTLRYPLNNLLINGRNTLILAVILVSPLLGGCSDEPREPSGEVVVSATVSAERGPDGQIRELPTAADRQAEMTRMLAVRREIDARFPASRPSEGDARFSVSAVDAGGIVELADGTRLRLAGIDCDKPGVEYLRQWLLSTPTEVIYQRTEDAVEGAIPVLLWEVESWDMPEMPGDTTFSFTSLNETALTSTWCKFQHSETNPMNDRYRALSKAFEEIR